jgi:hypothetical protein
MGIEGCSRESAMHSVGCAYMGQMTSVARAAPLILTEFREFREPGNFRESGEFRELFPLSP